jgi:hypothetical protein
LGLTCHKVDAYDKVLRPKLVEKIFSFLIR